MNLAVTVVAGVRGVRIGFLSARAIRTTTALVSSAPKGIGQIIGCGSSVLSFTSLLQAYGVGG